ncbi:hypothetical protein WJX81_001160 [Elliptochloris bilobata]|uniref:GST N-terminal domain-containing protein n=1 Tax=Elliptochloris bilobata TaxID=381761 RepID=A0AAW1QD01_9CHLO
MIAGLKKALGQDGGQDLDCSLHFSDAPSWEALEAMVNARQQELGWQPPDLETGPTNPLALRRTFNQPGEPEVKLYRDSAAWCPYCERVWLQLEEKRIPYTIEKINMRCYGDKPPEYTRKVPSGLLPALEVDGQLWTESAEIMSLLEERFPEHKPLLPPAGSREAARADLLLRLERRLYSDWLPWLCQGWDNAGKRARFEGTMDAVDAELARGGGPYFMGAELSLVECVFAPMLERIAASIPYYKGLLVRGTGRWPNVDRWFDAMETRETYLGLKSDFYTHVQDLPPQLGGCVSIPEAAEVAAAIDGTDGRSWHLPLPPLTRTSLEPHAPGEDPPVDTLRAAARLVGNHAAVTRFAARGCGRPGRRLVSAPLADPTAEPGEAYLPAVDAALRHVAHALLVGAEAKQRGADALSAGGKGSGSGFVAEPAAAALAYMRDRVGVPRDLPLPAARQLRAHCNFAIDVLGA